MYKVEGVTLTLITDFAINLQTHLLVKSSSRLVLKNIWVYNLECKIAIVVAKSGLTKYLRLEGNKRS